MSQDQQTTTANAEVDDSEVRLDITVTRADQKARMPAKFQDPREPLPPPSVNRMVRPIRSHKRS